MALFEMTQGEESRTFKDLAQGEDVENIFLNVCEFAEDRLIDGKTMRVLLEEAEVKEHSSHWEGGVKQNFDTGLYQATLILYVRVEDYGAHPKSGKQITVGNRLYTILECREEMGLYRMTLGRVRQ